MGAKGHAKAGRVQHREVVGAVADREGLGPGQPAGACQALQHSALAARVTQGRQQPSGRAATLDLEPVGLRQVEAERRAHPIGEGDEAARHQRRQRAARPHRLDQGPGARRVAQAFPVDVLEHRDRQPGEQGDPGLQRGAKIELAIHCAARDGRHLGPDADRVGELVDALDRDHGRVHVAHQEALLARRHRHDRDIDRRPGDHVRKPRLELSARVGLHQEVASLGLGQPAGRRAECMPDRGRQPGLERRAGRIGDQADHRAHRRTPGRARRAPEAAAP
jgi:hypothetical protein